MFEFVVPARNEQERVGSVVRSLKKATEDSVRVVVVDNASDDHTAQEARRAGADDVVTAERIGKGHAVVAGARACTGDMLLLCDADIEGLDPDEMIELARRTGDLGLRLGRLALQRPPADAPVTVLTALPLFRQFGITDVAEPLGGLVAVRRDFLLGRHLPGGWGFDVAMTLSAWADDHKVLEISAPHIRHRHRPVDDYIGMAGEVVATILTHHGVLPATHRDCTRCE
jgi:glucosyl-3-phosphoglycerate synthase